MQRTAGGSGVHNGPKAGAQAVTGIETLTIRISERMIFRPLVMDRERTPGRGGEVAFHVNLRTGTRSVERLGRVRAAPLRRSADSTSSR